MLLVNVGSHTINVDHVVAFIDDDDTVDVVFNAHSPDHEATAGDGSRYVLTLTGQEASRMRAWLDRNAEGVRGSEQTGFHIG